MRLLLIAAVLMTAAARPARDPCVYGPSSWCSSVDRALACNAFTHCLQTVWEPQLIDVVQTEVCVASQEQVDTARRVRSVDGQIQEALLFSLCNAAVEESMKQQCQTTVSTFLPQVFSLLESKMESSSVAALLGLCRQYDDDVMEEPEHTADSEPSECQSCQTFLTEVKELLNSPDAQEEVVAAVENVCSKFGDLEIWCKAVVDVAVPRLLKYLGENKEVAALCQQSAFCQPAGQVKVKVKVGHWAALLTSLLPPSQMQMDTDSEVICHDCEKVLTSVRTFDKDSNIRTSIEHTLAQLCSLTSLNENKCDMLWDKFSRVAEDLVKAAFPDVDVPYVCRAMVGCSSGEDEESAVSPTEPLENLMAPPAPLDPMPESPPDQSPYCTECVAVFEGVRQALQTDTTVDQAVSHAKQSLCTQVGILESQCDGLVDVFLPVILQGLTSARSPRLLCSQLRVCPEPTDLKGVDFVKLFDTTWQPNTLLQVGSFECDECQILVEDARAADRNPDVQKAIVDFFNEICDKLGQEASQCKALVEQYAPQLFEIIASELEPTVVCELLLHCTKPQEEQTIIDEPVPQITAENVVIDEEPQIDPEYRRESHAMKKKAKKALEKEEEENGLECTVCRLMMERLDNSIAANSTEEKLRGVLEEACALVPPELAAVCGQLVDTYTPSILHFLLQQLQPLLICDELQLCNTSQAPRAQHPPAAAAAAALEEEIMGDRMEMPIEEKELPGGETIQCDLCQQVVKAVDTALNHTKTEAAVQKALDEVCEVIPEEQQSQCLHLVDQYASVLVELLLLQERQPAQVCAVLALCPQSGREVQKGVKVALPKVKATPAPVQAQDSNASHHRKQTRSSEGGDGEEGCLLCQTLVGYVQEGLGDPTTLTQVEKLLDKACALLPDNLTKSCDTIVEQFTPLIFKLLQDKVNPLQICQELKLCSPAAREGRVALRAREEPGEHQPLGEEACTYGPSFWCASMDNARKCGMVQECVEKYGMEP